jgi:flagellar hook protein FlgE
LRSRPVLVFGTPFNLDARRNLVSQGGGIVQGYGIDDNFNVVAVADDINIPLGTLTIAEATRNVNLAGNLNASGIVAAHR